MENLMGEKIYKARRAKGFSQERMAELVGVSRQTISQWENDKFQPSSDNIDTLCKVLDMPREAFIGELDSANGGGSPSPSPSATKRHMQMVFVATIAVCSALAVISAFITALIGVIVFTSNTGDMMDNSYSIHTHAFYISLAVTLLLLIADGVTIALKIRNKKKVNSVLSGKKSLST